MDVVYICRDGENDELRYSLRSLANLPHDNVWVIGGAPKWYKGKRIKVKQSGDKYSNARRNLNALCDSPDITESFILMNDDFFIMRPVDDVPYLHGGSVYDKIKRHSAYAPDSAYVRLLWDTLHVLANRGCHTSYDYALHVPMVMEKAKLKPLLGYPASLRILYGNLYNVGGKFSDDVKYHRRLTNGPEPYDFVKGDSPYLSSSDGTFKYVYSKKLKRLFPEPSIFE